MSIAFTCPACGKEYKLKDELAGRTAKCSCGHTMTVPNSVVRVAPPIEMQSGGAASTAAVAQAPVAPPRVVNAHPPASDKPAKWYDKNAVVIILLVVFFPVGLYALWKNSRYTTKTKGIVTGVVVLLLFIGMTMQAVAKKTFEDADTLWAAGQQAEAVEKYKALVADNMDIIKEADRPRVFQRIIESEVQRGERSTAQHFIDKAKALGISVVSDIPEVKRMLQPPAPPIIVERKSVGAAQRTEERKSAGAALPSAADAGPPPAVGSQSGQSKSVPKSSEEVTALAWGEYVRDCGAEAQTNEPRAEKHFNEKYKNRIVQWSGIINSIKANMLSGNTMYLTMFPTESKLTGMDIALDMPADFDITSLNKGDKFSFIAKITIQGGNFSPHQLEYLEKPKAK